MTNVALESQTVATEYNGWSNRETWLANLWLNNDMSSYMLLRQAVSLEDSSLYERSQWLKDMLEEQLDDEIETPCLWRDLLQHAFRQVDWREIVENNREEGR
jgi:hypothetical protein